QRKVEERQGCALLDEPGGSARCPFGLLTCECLLQFLHPAVGQQSLFDKSSFEDPARTGQSRLLLTQCVRDNGFRQLAERLNGSSMSRMVRLQAGKLQVLVDQRRPPVMTKFSPVIHAESEDARNTAVGAMSCTCPMRPRGVCDSSCLRKSLSCNPAERTPSVSTMPGLMALTRMFRGPSSFARVRVIASTAPLVAL